MSNHEGLHVAATDKHPSTTVSASALTQQVSLPDSLNVWGVPFHPLTHAQTIDAIHEHLELRIPGYFITANVHYAMLSHRYEDLGDVNRKASFVVADGMPIVWWSRLIGNGLPERVAGADLIYSISELAATHGYRMFLLGGEDRVAQAAAETLQTMFPGLRIAGVESPPFRPLSLMEEVRLAERIRDSQADILLVALGQPKGERWIHRWYQSLETPVSVQLGGSFNFVSGAVQRAPAWIARAGLEWAYRLYREPRRLAPRYLLDSLFLIRMIARDIWSGFKRFITFRG